MNLSCDESLFTSNNNKSAANSMSKLNGRSYVNASCGINGTQQKCAFFIQSFNRENLQYAVEYKTSNAAALEKIVELIKGKYPNKCGIVYCISRNECESVK